MNSGKRERDEADRIEENPRDVKRADLIVGIPSYNEAHSIPYVTQQAALGLTTFFKGVRSAIINCDNHSPDHTKDAFLSVETDIPKIYISTAQGVKGKGTNLRNLFEKAVELDAVAIVVVDADLLSITPQWIKDLGEPLFQDYGYVVPIYVRHKYDGTITNHIAYPLTRALYGRRIRQPIGGDFGFSGQLARTYLESELWDEAVSLFGIDIWMTTLAMNTSKAICQVFLGGPKIHRTKDAAVSLDPMFKNILTTMFRLMLHFEECWKSVRRSKPTPIFGLDREESELPPPVQIAEERLYLSFSEGFTRFLPIYENALDSDVVVELKEIHETPYEHYELPPGLWAKILYEFAVAYQAHMVSSDDLIDSLVPLYLGRTGSYIRNTRGMEIRGVEEYIEDQCLVFEETKSYLLERWRRS